MSSYTPTQLVAHANLLAALASDRPLVVRGGDFSLNAEAARFLHRTTMWHYFLTADRLFVWSDKDVETTELVKRYSANASEMINCTRLSFNS